LSVAAVVHVVDDDASTRELLAWLMQRHGIAVKTYADASAFLAGCDRDAHGCVILDLDMPGMSGLDVQRDLKALGVAMPVIFLSGQADVQRAVHAVREGAVDFIEKPFDYKRVVALVQECLARDARSRAERARHDDACGRLALLTQREREVLDLVVAGRTNREVGEALDISVKTVEAHRAKVMEKLGVDSVAELVQAVVAAQARTQRA
jgi:FixJ family two-component response regulator